MSIVKLALKRPYTFVVLAILIFIFGGLAIVRTPTDIFPNIDILVVSIIWNYNGRSLFTALVLEDSGGDPLDRVLERDQPRATARPDPLPAHRHWLGRSTRPSPPAWSDPQNPQYTVVLRPAFVIVGGTR